MKRVTRNISLCEELDQFAQAEAEAGGYPTISAFFQDLLRQRRKALIRQDLKLLEAASAGALEEEPPDEFFRKVSVQQRKFRTAKNLMRYGKISRK